MKYEKTYKRSITLKLFNTKSKQRKIKALIDAYRKAVNYYLKTFETQEGQLNKETLARLKKTKLSERYKSNALKQALSIYQSCVKTKKKTPKFKGYPILDKKFIEIQEGNNKFDLWIKTSNLAKGKPIYLPTKKHKRLNYWLNKGKLIQGCELHEDKVIVWIEVIKEEYKEGKALGIDLGMNKLIATSERQYLGVKWKELVNKILRKKKNSLGYKRALRERDNYINYLINQLPWNELGILVYENLRNITKGSKGRRINKGFRIRQQHWVHRKVVSGLINKCIENRVRSVYVSPRNTSRMCLICSNVDVTNRKDELFVCTACGYKEDADYVGANNIVRKGLDWLSSLESLSK